MRPPLIVKPEVVFQSLLQLLRGTITPRVNVLVLHRPPHSMIMEKHTDVAVALLAEQGPTESYFNSVLSQANANWGLKRQGIARK